MVTMISESPHNDSEKRRKHSFDRTKANHASYNLSRQLQMRLQYARLKVEHGWQRQNLNEVENLYFHHSQRTGVVPSTAASPHKQDWITSAAAPTVLPVTDAAFASQEGAELQERTVRDKTPVPVTISQRDDSSGTSLQLNPSLTQDQMPDQKTTVFVAEEADKGMGVNQSDKGPTTLVREFASTPNSSLAEIQRLLESYASPLLSVGNVQPMSGWSPSVLQGSPSVPSFPNSVVNALNHDSALKATSIAPDSNTGAQRSTPVPRRPASRPLQLTNMSTAGSGSATPTVASPSSPFGASLTYDSFWSSHSSSALAYRSSLGNTNPGLGINSLVRGTVSSVLEPTGMGLAAAGFFRDGRPVSGIGSASLSNGTVGAGEGTRQ